MIDSAGSLILPHLSALIPCLLKATGELDSTKLSYLSTMVAGQSGTQEVVDSVRAEAAKSHYTMETLIKVNFSLILKLKTNVDETKFYSSASNMWIIQLWRKLHRRSLI